MSARLDGKVALVTGAARGIGAATARRFAEEGARVVLADRRAEEVEAYHEALDADFPGKTTFTALDVSQEPDWSSAVSGVVESFGRLDILVNNAGMIRVAPLAETNLDLFRKVLDTNLIGGYLGAQCVVPAMKARGGGAIVNFSSVQGIEGRAGFSAYAASKFAVRGLGKTLAIELGPDGIRVNTVCPAGGNPEMYAPWMDKVAGFMDETLAYNENRGIPGSASISSIVDAVLFLASDASRFTTGIDLPVDGGATAGCFIPGFNTL